MSFPLPYRLMDRIQSLAAPEKKMLDSCFQKVPESTEERKLVAHQFAILTSRLAASFAFSSAAPHVAELHMPAHSVHTSRSQVRARVLQGAGDSLV